MMRVLSLGAGVQSTTVALMSAAGEIEAVDHAIFADTGWEPAEVYDHLAKLTPYLEDAGIQVHRVSNGNIRTDHLDPADDRIIKNSPNGNNGRARTNLPVYLITSEGEPARNIPDGHGIARRTCTTDYKIVPIERKIRELLGLSSGQHWPLDQKVSQLFGISWDEIQRMRKSVRPAIVYEHPLIDLRMTRQDCHRWLAAHDWTAPRSACIGCPFHSDAEWRHLRDDKPDEWADAVEFDHAFRARHADSQMTLRGVPFLHNTRVPLDEADIDDPQRDQLSLFDETCEGFCGT